MARAGDVARTKVSAASPKSRVVFASRRRANGSSELALTVDERRSVRGARFEAPSREPRNRERRGTSREQPASPANTSERIGWGERGASLRAPRKSERRTPVRREQACGILLLYNHHKSVRASRTLVVRSSSLEGRTLVVASDRICGVQIADVAMNWQCSRNHWDGKRTETTVPPSAFDPVLGDAHNPITRSHSVSTISLSLGIRSLAFARYPRPRFAR